MDIIFEIFFQLFGETLIQVLFECLAELGLHSLSDTLKKPRNPVLSTVGFMIWGAIAGGLSLLIFPHSPIASLQLRQANLLITPIVAGAVMLLIGRQRNQRGQTLVKLDRFGYAFVFAFTMAVVRYVWAQ